MRKCLRQLRSESRASSCGKTKLIEKLVPRFAALGFKTGVISNDVHSKEDARRLAVMLAENMDSELIVGLQTGVCPTTAVRDDPSINIRAAEKLQREHPDLNLIFIESAGNSITLSFSHRLANFFIYMVDVADDKTIRKGGLGLREADLLIINKADLAPYIETAIPGSSTRTADLDLMMEDARKIRPNRPTVLVSLKKEIGIDEIMRIIREEMLQK